MGRLGLKSGDLSGPAASVDNSIARYAGISGKVLQGYTSGSPFISDDGVLSLPAQPSILVVPTGTLANVTGDGTAYTVVFATEIYDQNGDWDGASTFTAPVTGRYAVTVSLYIGQLTVGMTDSNIQVVTSNRTYTLELTNGGVSRDSNNNRSFKGTVIVDMDASDTLTAAVAISGGTKVADIQGAASPIQSYMAIQQIA